MESLDLITSLEGKLKAAVNLKKVAESSWQLKLKLMYDGDPAGNLSFNLDGYDESEVESIAKNIQNNAFMMREIDEYLWGEQD